VSALKHRTVFFLLAVLCPPPTCLHAAAGSIFIAQNAAGSADGLSCANAKALSFFNSGSNWGSGGSQIGPGTTVHLCGIFSSTAKIQGSGSAGSPITIVFESGAAFSAPTWGGSYALGSDAGSVSYITIDGGTNGSIKTTANGTGLATANDDGGIAFNPTCNNCEIRNMTIGPIYAHSANLSDSRGTGSVAVAICGSNVSVHHNTMHDAKWLLSYSYASGNSNVQLYSNTLYNCDHGVVVAGRSAGSTVSSVSVHDNVIHDFNLWDNAADLNHHDGVHAWADGAAGAGVKISGIQIYNNYVYGNFGAFATAGIYVEETDGGGAAITGTQVFNNVVNNNSANAPCCGLIYIKGTDSSGQPGAQVYNNTLIDGTNGSMAMQFQGSGVMGALFKNNIVSGAALGVDVNGSAAIASGGSDYNVFNPAGQNFIYNGGWISYSAWKSNAGGLEAHSVQANPNLNASFGLPSGSPAIGAALNLTGLNIPALDADKAGASRPAAGAWDAGAYQFSSVPPPPPPPSNACDVNGDSAVNVVDVQQEVNQALGIASCKADINKDGQCTVVDVQRVVNAALGGQCVTQ
jgi:hypothetical protein